MQTFSSTVALVVVIATMACASSSGSTESAQTATPSSRRSNEVMTEQELRDLFAYLRISQPITN